MAFSILLLATAWLVTAAAVLTVARLIAAGPSRGLTAVPAPGTWAPAEEDVVVALVPRGRNRVVPVGLLERAA